MTHPDSPWTRTFFCALTLSGLLLAGCGKDAVSERAFSVQESSSRSDISDISNSSNSSDGSVPGASASSSSAGDADSDSFSTNTASGSGSPGGAPAGTAGDESLGGAHAGTAGDESPDGAVPAGTADGGSPDGTPAGTSEGTEQETSSKSDEETAGSLSAEAVLPNDDDLVRVQDFIPNLLVDLKYATEDNFTGEIIYDFSDAYLRYGTVMRLQTVQEDMEARGLTPKIWDAFRPIEAQQALWEAYPDPTYVSNPDRGYTSHNFGNTIDITVVRSDGEEIPLPTGFDDFSLKADRDYSDCAEEEAENARMLEQAMEAAGFTGYQGEWWHYQDIDDYPGDDLADMKLSN
ncbi:MAG: D-alanyl-D-alanine carboxypeptidase family protein [Eubacterium sp.]|nr:D-alanyl-D-alanine carboxypeptidase family protein [Eubacterium sp.]